MRYKNNEMDDRQLASTQQIYLAISTKKWQVKLLKMGI